MSPCTCPFLVRFSVICSAAVLIAVGCAPPLPSGPDYPADSLDLSDAGNQTLTEVADRFLALVGDGSSPAAASALVAELQAGRAGVSLAALGSDGCTVFLQLADGSSALLNTNRTVFGLGDSALAAGDGRAGRVISPTADKDIRRVAARMLPGGFECPGKVTPSTRNVLIINTAAVSNPSTDDYVQQLQDALITDGWQPTEIEVRSRAGAGDRRFTPISLTDVAGYGMVFVIAQGCVAEVGGVQRRFIQCCRPGKHTDVLSADLLAETLGERDRGRLIRCQTPKEGGGFVSDIYIRDDCLMEKMKATPGALVYFVAPHSWPVASELAEGEAGSTLGWDGAFRGTDGQRVVLGMLSRMTDAVVATTDVQAYENAIASGLGVSEDPLGHSTQARIAGTPGDFYLPAWGVFTVDAASIPSDAVQVDVDVTYADCPDFSLSFTMEVSDTVETLRLPSGEATIALKAMNAAGEVVGTGLEDVPVHGGRNDIVLKTCKTKVSLYLIDYPATGANAVSRIRVEFVYPDVLRDPPLPAELGLSAVGTWSAEVWAGTVSVRSTALNAAGQIVGEQTSEEDFACGRATVDLCFGWVRFEATRSPPGTASIRVVSDSANAPGPFTLAPGGSTEACGFRVDGVVHFTAEALDASGGLIASQNVTATIACGENAVPLDLVNYGIIVSADPNKIAANGVEQSEVTATLRYLQPGDKITPSGPPVVGKQVQFDTTLGSLSGANPAVTDSNGQVTVQLSGTADGLATVVAFVTEDTKEGQCTVQIGNANLGDYLFVNYGGAGQQLPGSHGVVGAVVKDSSGNGVAGVPVAFRLLRGALTLDAPLEKVTNKSGRAEVVVRSDGPAIGLVEAAVPGTLLVKRCIAYLQFSGTLSPSQASIAVDTGEQTLIMQSTVDLASLGLPYRWVFPSFSRQGRLVRGGTAVVEGSAGVEWIPNTATAKVNRGTEPGTVVGITARPYVEFDGELQQLGWVPLPEECRVEFFQDVVATLPITFESRQRPAPNAPGYYEAKVVARFAGSGISGNFRYLVINPSDNGQYSGDWWDGRNRVAVNTISQVSIVIAEDTYLKTEPPDAWIAERLQTYSRNFSGLSITVSAYPYPYEVYTSDNATRSYDPWRDW
ncbi:MAG TPA: Ig-like domain-containing protein [Phycisphaerae bacterium]|nr:Ig-like domain-containing protein [Phycisphaerae bacterium]HRY68409.1 Ig-like domain-containing protein [Phycisphaerae bacterium]HSA27826.1 Ig-like domain-containing protein [Phycisphaerae bacterium]